MKMAKLAAAISALAVAVTAQALPAAAGSESGNFMVRVLGTVVAPDSNAKISAGGAPIAGDAEASTEVIPAATLSYFLTKNVAVELFCCFSKHEVDGKGALAGLGEVADTWVFPPAVTLQYHFDGLGAFKPYVGAGFQYIYAFYEGVGDNALGATGVKVDDAIGLTLQAGIDISMGGGWYLNADVKKTWIEHEVSWTGTGVTADLELDPWIVSAGLGYRFNLDDLFARRNETSLK
jgi:outer membrane protein